MAAAPARLWRHLGWRGLALAGVGACWIVYGIGLIVTTRGAVTAGAAPVIRLMCIEAWGGVWIASGVLASVAGMLRPGRDVWGFAAISFMPAVWGLAFMASAVTGDYQAAWAAVPIYVAVLLLVVIVATLTRGRTHG
ncbi:hypothetical protein [Streptomyces enissocaesilis]|uniref:Integral membrane protein n=1 Tax=Streptomyces enissocaesilis TaxID=332589 RepID=A0ABN3XN08_9ACTN